MKKILVLIGLVISVITYGQDGANTGQMFYLGSGVDNSSGSTGVTPAIVSNIAGDSARNALSIATGRISDSVLNVIALHRKELSDSLDGIKRGRFNVIDFGASVMLDATNAIKAAIEAAEDWGYGATLVIPDRFTVSDSLVFTTDGITITGGGTLYCETAGIDILKIRDCSYVNVLNITIEGDGGNWGAGGTTERGILLDHARYCRIEGNTLKYLGSHAIEGINGTWGEKISYNIIIHNLKDGIRFVTNTSQKYTGQNGNDTDLIGNYIAACNGDGVEWVAINLHVIGGSIENLNGSGVQIGSLDSDASAQGAYLSFYGENNDSSHVKIICNQTGPTIATGIIIEGCTFYSSTAGDDACITQFTQGTYTTALRNTTIQNNTYSISGTVTKHVNLESSNQDVYIVSPFISGMDIGALYSLPARTNFKIGGVDCQVSYGLVATASGADIPLGVKNVDVDGYSNANYVIFLPKNSTVIGNYTINGRTNAYGVELRVEASQATTVYLNGVTNNVEAAIPANTSFEIKQVDSIHWILKAWSALGAELTAIIPDAI